MNRTRRIAVATLAAVLVAPALAACNKSVPSTCDTFSLSTTVGGKGGGGKSGKSNTTKTKPKTKTGTGGTTTTRHDDDDCDDD